MSIKFPPEFLDDYEWIGSIRGFQIALAENYTRQMMRCPMHLSIGQEYWLPAFRRQVEQGDRCFSSHRSHSMYMAMGGDFEKMIAELHGHENGSLGGRGGSMHLKDLNVGLEQSIPIVGSSLGLALGSALASKKREQNVLTISYFGDGACEEGILHESLNMSAILELPILFICENNMYSCNTHVTRRQSDHRMSRFAEAHNLLSDSINESMPYDVVVRKLSDAFKAARNQPFFLEVYSYRLYEHCGYSIDTSYGDRTYEEFEQRARVDAFNTLRREYLSVELQYEEALAKYAKIIDRYTMYNEKALLS
jgi:TPP-dependent pyruvate/acetoin dehydrogenase alpha subunit